MYVWLANLVDNPMKLGSSGEPRFDYSNLGSTREPKFEYPLTSNLANDDGSHV